jgi:hypothetical protein
MSVDVEFDQTRIREAIAGFEISPSVAPNDTIDIERVFFPITHRGVLDMKRQLVVGNRGMGKSFWTHALTNPNVRERVANAYSIPVLAKTNVVLGFNGSTKLSGITPTVDEIQAAHKAGDDSELIWRAVILRAIQSLRSAEAAEAAPSLTDALNQLKNRPRAYAEELTAVDEASAKDDSFILVVFDALDRLSHDWASIRGLTKGLLVTVLGLQSFRSIRAKIFMRVDQFADPELFRFPDGSKIRNDYVNLAWKPYELYGLLFFEMLRQEAAAPALKELANRLDAHSALPIGGRLNATPQTQELLITAIAGEFMGSSSKRGRVYTWVPLHLSDAANNCSPRTFLTAWKTAAEHVPAPQKQAVDHLGLSEGVRRASNARLTELGEDYPWINLVLAPLRRQFVPIERSHLFELWEGSQVIEKILGQSSSNEWLAPIGVIIEHSPDALLQTMASIAVMEKRANGKINVPDIFRVEAEILRKGGVAVPRKN